MKEELRNILEEYANQRAKEETRVNDLLKKLIDENPEFKRIRQEYSSIRANQIRAKLEGRAFDVEGAKKKYNNGLKSACKKSGTNEKELETRYICSDCKDTGYIGKNQKTLCHCLVNKATQSILSSQNLIKDATFDNFDESIFPNDKKIDKEGRTQREHILHIKTRAQKWCDAYPNTNKQQALFIGATGVGKSFMISCMAHRIIEKGYSVVNATASGINEAMLKVINQRDNSIIGLFKSCDLLIIDDLGVEPVLRNITVETLYEIIEYRISNKKHTIICTNITLPVIEDRYGHRISSRISSTKNTSLMKILGDDLRRL